MFDPIKVVADIKAIEKRLAQWESEVLTAFHSRISDLEKRVAELEGGISTAGVGHTQMQAEEIGTFSGKPNETPVAQTQPETPPAPVDNTGGA